MMLSGMLELGIGGRRVGTATADTVKFKPTTWLLVTGADSVSSTTHLTSRVGPLMATSTSATS